MKFAVLAIGTRGDVQPLVALSMGLQASGHTVRFVTHAIFAPMVHQAGLEFFGVKCDPLDVLETKEGQQALQEGSTPWRTWKGLSSAFKSKRGHLGNECLEASRDADVICVSTISFIVGGSIAEKLNLPVIPLFLQPVSPTRSFPSLFVTQHNLGGFANRLTYRFTALAIWLPFSRLVNEWRTTQLGLPPVGPNYVLRRQARKDRPMIYGFSRHLVQKPQDWGEHIHITGFWFVDGASDWQPPAALEDFLEAGPPPVYLGFGSMINRRRGEMTAYVLEALERTEQRGLLQTGWGQLSASDLPDNTFQIDSVPHDWLFRRMSVIVHHGGAGTTASALRAGLPSIVVPFTADQPFWGQRVAELGVGPKPIPCRKLTAARLAEAIRVAATNESIRKRAAAVGERIRTEDGVARAVEVINRYLASLSG